MLSEIYNPIMDQILIPVADTSFEVATPRLILREFVQGDFSQIQGIAVRISLNTDKNMQYYVLKDESTMEDWFKGVLAEKTNIVRPELTLAVCLKDTPDILIGSVAIMLNGSTCQGDIGYFLDPLHQGKGYNHEASVAMQCIGFKIMDWDIMEATVNPSNTVSLKSLCNLGYKEINKLTAQQHGHDEEQRLLLTSSLQSFLSASPYTSKILEGVVVKSGFDGKIYKFNDLVEKSLVSSVLTIDKCVSNFISVDKKPGGQCALL